MAVPPQKGHDVHFMSRFYGRVFRAPILYNTHREVIFVIAQFASKYITKCRTESHLKVWSSEVSDEFWASVYGLRQKRQVYCKHNTAADTDTTIQNNKKT